MCPARKSPLLRAAGDDHWEVVQRAIERQQRAGVGLQAFLRLQRRSLPPNSGSRKNAITVDVGDVEQETCERSGAHGERHSAVDQPDIGDGDRPTINARI